MIWYFSSFTHRSCFASSSYKCSHFPCCKYKVDCAGSLCRYGKSTTGLGPNLFLVFLNLKWFNKTLLQYRGASESYFFGGQQNFAPNLVLCNIMVLFIVSFLSLLCMLHSSSSCFNQLLHSNNKLSMSLTLNPCTNQNVNGVY